MRKFFSRNNILYQYILSYGALLLVPVLLIVGMSAKTLKDNQKELISLSQKAFHQSVDNIETRFGEVTNLAQLIADNKNLQNALKEPDYYDLYQLYHDLEQYCLTNSFIRNIYVLFEQDNVVVGNDGVITNYEHFYRMKYDQGMQQYQLWVLQQSSDLVYTSNLYSDDVRTQFDDTETMLHYTWLVTSGMGNTSRSAQILFFIEEDQLRPLVADQISGMTSFAVYMNGNSNVIGLNNMYISDGRNKGEISLSQEVASGRQYFCTIQKDYLFKVWYDQLILNIIFLVFACLIGGGLTLYLARRNSIPILNMVRLVDGDGERSSSDVQNVFDYLHGSMSDILKDRQKLQEELERRIPMLQAIFIERLLSGTLSDYSDLEKQMENLRISLHGDGYCVAIFQITAVEDPEDDENQPPFSAARIAVEHVIYTCAGENVFLNSMENDQITVILPLAENNTDADIQQLCHQIVQQAEKMHHIRLRGALGRSYTALADVFLSYAQAKKAIDSNHEDDSEDIVLYTQAGSPSSYFYYPPEMEQKLLRVTLSGNTKTIDQLFDELEEENLEKRKISSAMYQSLIGELRGTWIKLLASLQENKVPVFHLESILQVPSLSGNQEDEFSVFRMLFQEAGELVLAGKSSRVEEYKSRIIEWMENHYTDPMMSLGMLADDFKVTEVYMSRLFKESIGMLFSQYLEKMRMERAKTLLMEGQSVTDVAEKCGYQSPHAFRRAFKRYYDLLPSEIRRES